ncbi:hypothetical protein BCV69DRAFT_283962 [Microstroma glucosiphilum]|uniref:Uncharacterized protein n=1 Tax=Pseudomicrostroma glucosiphilum TaxID=1684307 RepID=A0A316U5X2_9BASI|nr:hypothetical protein BCV69DRAFT_283962 [Pseudomicrostroma glucosiphilum]PWN19861.1 hypothetical protein BCV69DRAFT_283962 [Pseudomicrostroma glucosiphilum]
MPPPLRPAFGTGGQTSGKQANANTRANSGRSLSYEEPQEGVCDAANQVNHYEEEGQEEEGSDIKGGNEDEEDTDVFSQARLSEAESFSKRQGLAMSIVLEEEEEE